MGFGQNPWAKNVTHGFWSKPMGQNWNPWVLVRTHGLLFWPMCFGQNLWVIFLIHGSKKHTVSRELIKADIFLPKTQHAIWLRKSHYFTHILNCLTFFEPFPYKWRKLKNFPACESWVSCFDPICHHVANLPIKKYIGMNAQTHIYILA